MAFEQYRFIAPLLETDTKLKIELTDPSDTRHSWTAQLVRSEGVIDSDTCFIYLVAEIDAPYQQGNQADSPPPLQFGRFLHAKIAAKQLQQIYKIPRHLVKRGAGCAAGSTRPVALSQHSGDRRRQ